MVAGPLPVWSGRALPPLLVQVSLSLLLLPLIFLVEISLLEVVLRQVASGKARASRHGRFFLENKIDKVLLLVGEGWEGEILHAS